LAACWAICPAQEHVNPRPMNSYYARLVESGDLEPRVSALEEQVRSLAARVQSSEQDAAAARVLAGAADRDVSEFRGEIRDFRRATSASFNARRQDFVDLRHDISDLRNDVDDGFVEMRGKFDGMAAGQQQIVDLLQSITEQRHGDTTE
jgi:chromosome segregation ATPase